MIDLTSRRGTRVGGEYAITPNHETSSANNQPSVYVQNKFQKEKQNYERTIIFLYCALFPSFWFKQ